MLDLLKTFLLGVLICVINLEAFAQTGILQGIVISENNTPVKDVSVFIKNTTWSVTDEYGSFNISDIPYGNYILKTSRLGYAPVEIEIKIDSSLQSITILLEEKIYGDIQAVVTASRTALTLENSPTPIDVISEQEIQSSGMTTLKDVLLEQSGISLSPNEENAIQIQGFESDYTLILIDGQPVIGRTRGALDVSRIHVLNIKQIEIIKGPSSALWGSDALAGVVNIITKKNTDPFSLNSHIQYGSRNSYDVGTSLSFVKKQINGSLGFFANGSDGFDLSTTQFGNNQNPFNSVTFNSKFGYDINDLTSIIVSGRYYLNRFRGPTLATVQNQVVEIEESGWQNDASLHVRLETSPFSNLKSTITAYSTRYEDQSDTFFEDTLEADIRLNNRQGLDKIEAQNDYSWNANNITTVGGGTYWEFVRAERYQGKREQNGSFAFLQHQIFLNDKLYVISGARFDSHSSYASYVSPKLSLRYSITNEINVKASVGKGFKAPDFRTLYLNFDNSGSGYRLYGTRNILAEIETFRNQGLIKRNLVDISNLNILEPEFSTAYNIGVNIQLKEYSLTWILNFFRNDAQNLIDAREVVELNDESTIFGYLNIEKARTQGFEFETIYSPFSRLTTSFNYQYLQAVELTTETRTILENGIVITKEFDIEIPLPKRPKHSANIKFFYKEPFFDSVISLRGILRGTYFYNDKNADGKANQKDDDFVNAHSVWNLTLSKELKKRFRAQIGIHNLFNYTDSQFLQAQPGRTLFSKLFIEI